MRRQAVLQPSHTGAAAHLASLNECRLSGGRIFSVKGAVPVVVFRLWKRYVYCFVFEKDRLCVNRIVCSFFVFSADSGSKLL